MEQNPVGGPPPKHFNYMRLPILRSARPRGYFSPVKHFIFAIASAVTVAFAAGIIIGHYALPTASKASASAFPNDKQTTSASRVRSDASPDSSAPATGGSSPEENLIGAIKIAVAHHANEHVYSELNELIDALDPKSVRPVMDAVQKLPNQREKNTFLSMLISRWAEADPQVALAYAQTKGTGAEDSWLVRDVVTSWAENDSAAATTWVTQLPPGQERKRALQSLVSVLAEEDPQGALNFLQSLPESGQGQMLYAPVFSRLASTDPVTAGQRASQFPAGSTRDMALQLVASTWAEQHAEAAYAWANNLPAGQARNNALQIILSRWANTDPQRVATMTAELPAGPMRDQAIADIARQWAENESRCGARLDGDTPGW